MYRNKRTQFLKKSNPPPFMSDIQDVNFKSGGVVEVQHLSKPEKKKTHPFKKV